MALVRTAFVFVVFYWFWLWYVPFRVLQQEVALLRAPVVLALGGALCLAGFVITALCAAEFALRGRGTPAPFDPPRRLVTGALYRRIRNPMYGGFILLLAGEAVLFGSRAIALLAVVFWIIVHGFVLFYEEPTLRRKFGAQYEAYQATVPRWIPKLRA